MYATQAQKLTSTPGRLAASLAAPASGKIETPPKAERYLVSFPIASRNFPPSDDYAVTILRLQATARARARLISNTPPVAGGRTNTTAATTMKHATARSSGREVVSSVHKLKVSGFCVTANTTAGDTAPAADSRCVVDGHGWEIRFQPAVYVFAHGYCPGLDLVTSNTGDVDFVPFDMRKTVPKAFHRSMDRSVLLCFIYTDVAPLLDWSPGAAATMATMAMAQHLHVAADRYGLDRLKAICERRLPLASINWRRAVPWCSLSF
ncbi:hypothetical protein HU200_057168 [Digitaria exilis]|uniref:Uncharacterized protein n=1 Tax=Digitaria exilis TaxID=1010633 RepID=A0A835ABI3_9POAL|nr:hypothetical protein HU200_057168 [Digitaria exilis]